MKKLPHFCASGIFFRSFCSKNLIWGIFHQEWGIFSFQEVGNPGNKASARFWSPFPTRRPAATAGNPCDFVGCVAPWGQEEGNSNSSNSNSNTSSGSAGNNGGGGYITTQLSAKENTRVFSVFSPCSTFLPSIVFKARCNQRYIQIMPEIGSKECPESCRPPQHKDWTKC